MPSRYVIGRTPLGDAGYVRPSARRVGPQHEQQISNANHDADEAPRAPHHSAEDLHGLPRLKTDVFVEPAARVREYAHSPRAQHAVRGIRYRVMHAPRRLQTGFHVVRRDPLA